MLRINCIGSGPPGTMGKKFAPGFELFYDLIRATLLPFQAFIDEFQFGRDLDESGCSHRSRIGTVAPEKVWIGRRIREVFCALIVWK